MEKSTLGENVTGWPRGWSWEKIHEHGQNGPLLHHPSRVVSAVHRALGPAPALRPRRRATPKPNGQPKPDSASVIGSGPNRHRHLMVRISGLKRHRICQSRFVRSPYRRESRIAILFGRIQTRELALRRTHRITPKRLRLVTSSLLQPGSHDASDWKSVRSRSIFS